MRIRAFTLIELLVVMILSSVVVALAWMVFSYFQLFGLEYRRRLDDSRELLLLDQSLRIDAHGASDVAWRNDSLWFNRRDELANSVQYYQVGRAIIRLQNSITDTFKVEIESIGVNPIKRGKSVELETGYGTFHHEKLRYEVLESGIVAE